MRFQANRFTPVPAASVPAAARAAFRGRDDATWIGIEGRTAVGEAVYAFVEGVQPYVYLDVGGVDGSARLESGELGEFRSWLESAIKAPLLGVDIVHDAVSLFGAEAVCVVRVTPARVASVRRLADVWHEGRAHFRGRQLGVRVWEADVPLTTRFAIAAGAVPHSWMTLGAGAVALDGGARCERMYAVHASDVRAEPCEGDGLTIAPLPLVAWDIECLADDRFPNAALGDRVILIGFVLYRDATATDSDDNVVERIAFIDGSTDVTPASADRYQTTILCPDEAGILLAAREYLNRRQPDIMTGYNTNKFDWPFVLERARQLNIYDTFCDIGRVPGIPLRCETSSFVSSARGAEDDVNIVIAGIIDIDMLRWVRTAHKLRSYRLDAVAKKFLGKNEGKTGVTYKEIPGHYHGTADMRARLVEYCIYDAELAARIAFAQRVVDNYISMARVTGVDIHSLITRGQGIKVHTQLLRFCSSRRILVPTLPRAPEAVADEPEPDADAPDVMRMLGSKAPSSGGAAPAKRHKGKEAAKYDGATVLDPIRGYYPNPITTLDFSSLYPSIMIAHNLCYYTLVRAGERCAHNHDAATSADVLGCCVMETPTRARFWRAHVREGVLPAMLKNLLAARAAAKREMAAAFALAKDMTRSDAERAAAKRAGGICNCQQLNFKLSCNSIYGFTGAVVGKLPELRISASVTSFGRDMILYIVGLVERVYRGHVPGISEAVDAMTLSALVVYGDTDSIMVRFGVECVADAMAIGRHAATLINAAFRIKYLTDREAEALRQQYAPQYATLEEALIADMPHYIPLFTKLLDSAISILFEKVLFPYLLINKKRYVGNFYEKGPDVPDKLHQSGIESVRRDNALYTADTMEMVVACLMNTRDPIAALGLARQRVRALARNQVALDDLVISKSLSKPPEAYARPASEVHLVVNARRDSREPGTAYRLGDRVPYVFVLRPGQVVPTAPKLVDFAEDVDYARAAKLVPWSAYYVNNQLRKPLTRIFDTVWGEGASNSLLFTHDVVTATSTAPVLGMFAAAAAPATPAAPESRESLERRVRTWTSRPQTTSLLSMFSAARVAAQ